jgi:hypothetical protein
MPQSIFLFLLRVILVKSRLILMMSCHFFMEEALNSSRTCYSLFHKFRFLIACRLFWVKFDHFYGELHFFERFRLNGGPFFETNVWIWMPRNYDTSNRLLQSILLYFCYKWRHLWCLRTDCCKLCREVSLDDYKRITTLNNCESLIFAKQLPRSRTMIAAKRSIWLFV